MMLHGFEMNGMGSFNSKAVRNFIKSSLGSSEQDKKKNCRYEQLEQDIVRNFATVETANVQITLPEKKF